ncbi:MAG: glycosyltransferase family 39 protein [Nitrospinota bacterium]
MKRSTLVFLALILLGALFLRTYRLSEVGLRVGNESKNYGGAAKIATHLRWWLTQEGSSLPGKERRETLKASIERVAGTPGSWHPSKPFFGLLTVLAFVLFGPSPYHLLMISAVLGAATVGLAYWLARRLGRGEVFALMGALAMSVSGFHLIWSRSGFAHSTATLLLTLGLACYAQAIWGGSKDSGIWLLISGLVLGAGVASHPVVAPYIGVCFLTEIYRIAQGSGIRRGLRNLVLLGAGVGVILVSMELLTRMADRAVLPHFSELYAKFQPYSGGLLADKETAIERAGLVVSLRWLLSGNFLMPFLYGEGVVMSFLVATGLTMTIVRLWRERKAQDFFLFVGFLLPLAFFLAAVVKPFARNLAPLTPFIALLAGISLASGWRRYRGIAWRFGFIAFVVGVQLFHVSYLFNIRSGYAAASDWLAQSGGGIVLVKPSVAGVLLYNNGVKNVFEVEKVPGDEQLNAVHAVWMRPARICGLDKPVYASLVAISERVPERYRTWLPAVNWDAPAASFPNPEPFTRKKMELLHGIRQVAARLGLQGILKKVDNLMREERHNVAVNTIHLFRNMGPPCSSNPESSRPRTPVHEGPPGLGLKPDGR